MDLGDIKFLEYIEKKVRQTIKRYSLFTRKDKIAVAVSGGKDSITCLFILKKLGYDVEAITIDAQIGSYTKDNLKTTEGFCNDNNIALHIISFREEFGSSLCHLKSILSAKGFSYSSCMLCGILKRYLLNKHSKRLGFTILATGHNLDDEAQAFIMNIFRNDPKSALRQGPVSGTSQSEKFVRRVKPLYLIREEEVIRYSKIRKFPVNYGICPCSVDAYRRQYIKILDEFEKKHPSVKYNIIKFHETLIMPQKKEVKGTANTCAKCGEPSARGICRTCQIFSALK